MDSDKLDTILNAIRSSMIYLKAKVDAVAIDVNLLRTDHKKLADLVTQSEKALVELQPRMTDLELQIWNLTEQVCFPGGQSGGCREEVPPQ